MAAASTVLQAEAYQYDANGNRIGGGQVVGLANRILSDAQFDYEYDNQGNMTRRVDRATGDVTTFSYDHRNRLTHAETRSDSGTLLSESSFMYDVFDRLIKRLVDGVATATVYDGSHPWVDFSAAGAVLAWYLYGEGADEILARWRPGDGQAWYLCTAPLGLDTKTGLESWVG